MAYSVFRKRGRLFKSVSLSSKSLLFAPSMREYVHSILRQVFSLMRSSEGLPKKFCFRLGDSSRHSLLSATVIWVL
jgi:hypothetical protein